MGEKAVKQAGRDAVLDAARLADRVEISELLSRYCSMVDDKRIDVETVAATFTPDGRYVAPHGIADVGPEAIAASKASSFSHFRATHHVTSDHIIDFDGDTARLRANMTAMHLWSEEDRDPLSLQTHFVAGGIFEAIAVRTAEGWRFRELTARITWRAGASFSTMARIVK